ncbi:hypothetical protein HID58_059640 [Brassica napus]|uniref:Uncharacterized protein n=1 Tax=Brassica napus TaxID=3708 RepID=A0ABQ7ZTH1_BRANA|nr:hypothetical protein HID58_059640 [Brassica napus]
MSINIPTSFFMDASTSFIRLPICYIEQFL